MHEKTEYDFVVIGGGAASTAIMAQLAKMKPTKPFKVAFIEKGTEFGPGFPYSEKVVLRDHIVNSAASCIDISNSEIRYSELSDFIRWARTCLSPQEIGKYRLSDAIVKGQLNIFVPRYVIGRYLKARFEQFFKQARYNGITIDLMPKTEAVNIQKGDHGRGVITLTNGTQIASANIMLATGHWEKSRFPETKGYFQSPWPAHKLIKEVPAEHIGIIGSNLGAIDTAVTLATKFGKFTRNREKKLIYSKNPGADNFAMTMYSHSGQLPEVTGYVINKVFSYKHVTGNAVAGIVKENAGFMPIDTLFELFKRELLAQKTNLQLRALIPDIDSIKLEDFFSRIEMLLTQKDIKIKLQDDIARARKSIDSRHPIPLQNAVFQSYAIFSEVTQFFSAEDLMRYKRVMPTIHKFVSPFPVQNAEKMLALIEAGCLNNLAVGAGVTERPSVTGKGLDISWSERDGRRTYHHDNIIDALGQSGDLEHDQSPLCKSLLNNGFTQPVFIPFRDHNEGRRLRSQGEEKRPLDNVYRHASSGCIEQLKDGRYYYRAPGVLMDMNKFMIISPESAGKVPNIYTVGSATCGQTALLQDLGLIASVAETVVQDIEARLGLGKTIADFRAKHAGVESVAGILIGHRANAERNVLGTIRKLASDRTMGRADREVSISQYL